MANIYTKIVTLFLGKLIGTDSIGNRYFVSRDYSTKDQKRWVIYANNDDASEVPAIYHAWLHYTIDAFPDVSTDIDALWQLPHQPNMSGTMQVWRPTSAYGGGTRPASRSDYIPWLP